MYKLFLTFRYLRKGRIAYFAIAAVMLCTAMVLIVMSVMGGFLDQLKTKARGLLGDIILDNKSYSGFPLYAEFISDVSAWPEVVRATPVLYSYGLLRFHGTPRTNTVRVVGVRLADVYEVNAFRQGLFYEKYYPGTTSLAEQRQPLVGFDRSVPPVEWRDESGTLIGHVPPPVLPPEYEAALAKSWAANVRNDESPPNDWAALCTAAKRPVITGEYEMVAEAGPPQMAGDPWPGLIIGRDIIAERMPDGRYRRFWQYPRGRLVTLTLVPALTSGALDTPIKQPFRYVDDSRTGIFEIDSEHVYCDFDLLQKLLGLGAAPRANGRGDSPARCSQIQLKMKPKTNASELAAKLQAHYRQLKDDPRFADQLDATDLQLMGDVEAMTWEKSQEHIIAPVEKERQLVTILFGIISLVAAVLVLCILYMIVLQKTRDIGIIKSIGGSSAGVAAIFISYGAAVGVVGSSVGVVLGCAFVRNINDIQAWLTRMNPSWQVWDRAVYSFDEIPHTVRGTDVVTVFVAAILASTIGSLLAAWRAGAMQPVEALRHE